MFSRRKKPDTEADRTQPDAAAKAEQADVTDIARLQSSVEQVWLAITEGRLAPRGVSVWSQGPAAHLRLPLDKDAKYAYSEVVLWQDQQLVWQVKNERVTPSMETTASVAKVDRTIRTIPIEAGTPTTLEKDQCWITTSEGLVPDKVIEPLHQTSPLTRGECQRLAEQLDGLFAMPQQA
ncbi:hypothetical protein KDA23_03385 [Candidatus Saccharibacteria bacterium]|nr:hypothetical protein [Candidatus Saccharibacteria bacterium]